MKRIILSLLALIAINIYADVPPGYYNNAMGKKDAMLKTAMHNIIRPHTRIDYGSDGTWTVFRTSDVRSDGSIWDMYSNEVRYFPESGSHSEMHIEHSVPKSWWGEESSFIYEASFDLHHLVPADASTNMSKSNNMLGEVDLNVAVPSWDNGVSKIGKMKIGDVVYPVFEPHDDYKGDFARMYMYVATCYQDYTWVSDGLCMFNSELYPTLNDYSKELLMKWHRNDPVSVKEINRNEAVYEAQSNRNPFIDFPLLAEYLWGDSIGREFVMDITEKPYLVTPSHGEKIDMGIVMTGSTLAYDLFVKGENVETELSLSWRCNAGISLDKNKLSVASILDGVKVKLQYVNSEYVGVLRDTLIISGGGMVRNVELPVELNGTSLFVPLEPLDVTSVNATLHWVEMAGAESYRVKLYEGASEATDLFISAYVEGSSYNKALALYNGTSHSVNMADYALAIQYNGDGEFVNQWQLPNKVLASGETYVIVNSSCKDDGLRAIADYLMPSMETSPINFNGNDAVALYHNAILTDVVGVVGTAGNWGKDMTLYRSRTTLGPTVAFDVSSWEQASVDDYARLSSHSMSGILANPKLVVDKEIYGTQLHVEALKPSTAYTYYVTALLGNREHESAYGCAFTTVELATPTDLIVGNIYSDCFELSWNDVVGADGYQVECFIQKDSEPVTVNEGFDNVKSNGKPLPEGWVGTVSGYYDSTASTGISAPSIKLQDKEYLQTPEYSSPVVVMSFMYRFASKAEGSSLLIEYLKNGIWQQLQKIEYTDTKKVTLEYVFEASENVRAFRYTYNKVSGNLAIDDVFVTYSGCDDMCPNETYYTEQPNIMVRNLERQTDYSVKVRSVLDGICSEWSDVLFVKTNERVSTSVTNLSCPAVRYVIDSDGVVLYNLPSGCHVSLYNIQGLLHYDGVAMGGEMFVKKQPSGVYIIKLDDKKNIAYLKVCF